MPAPSSELASYRQTGRVEVVRRSLADVRFGSKADISACPRHVRFTPKSGHQQNYSVTSSARVSRVGGIDRPIALAVVALMANSNFVGCSTAISLGFVPRRILSTNSAARRKRAGW